MPDQRDALRNIHTFPQLIRFLRDDLDWPIESDDFEELTFDYTPEELGIDTASAAKIQEIKRLRPLSASQPWGIFFVKFEPKRLPVVALRRMLSRIVLKKRASANSADRAAWQADDLLFVSNYGEGTERQISFAHFSQNAEKADLPTLKVLGWDNRDTVLHLDDVATLLHQKLAWPEDEKDVKRWRELWRSAFTLRHREVITTSKDLAVRLAELAGAIRERIRRVLAIETEKGPLTRLMKAFQQALIHDLSADDFADMYAQTIAYGLLSARVAHPAHDTADAVATHIPVTNPFLKELMETFLHLGGRKRKERGGDGIDFDELGVSEVVELLDAANMEAVVHDFGDRNRDEDPVIHFYELFLKEYDAKKRMQRGVFYTPQPVVSYIVRSVHELLQTKFGLEDGLADTTTWGEMLTRRKDLRPPAGIVLSGPFVQILDPATGTATFLVEVIDVIHRTLTTKWKQQHLTEPQQRIAWNEYVPKHLLPRLHGFELMMAPYAIAHMKIGLKLYETGYRFGSDERARIYLTNALEPASDESKQMTFAEWVPALAHEANAVNAVKRNQHFSVVIGNPPYSKASQNLGQQFLNLIERFRFFDELRIHEPGAILFERDINNDYVKFLGFNRKLIEFSGIGMMGMITSNSYLDGKNFRGVRDALCKTFNDISVTNLHGDSRSGALARQGIADENVFEIETGVCILIGAKTQLDGTCSQIKYSEVTGTYIEKAALLLDYSPKLQGRFTPIDMRRYKSFLPSESSMLDEYASFRRLDEIFGIAVDGIKTSRDGLVIANTFEECSSKIQEFMNFSGSAQELEEKFAISVSNWDYDSAQRHLRQSFSEKRIFRIAYRPLDFRHIYYDSELVFSHREERMCHLIRGDNLALVCASRLSAKGFNHLLLADCLVEMKYASHDTNSRVFPVYLLDQLSSPSGGQPNTGKAAADVAGSGSSALPWTELTQAIFAILNAPKYRARYYEEIKNDFPAVPPLDESDFRQALASLGRRLERAQLLKSEIPQTTLTFHGKLGEAIRTPELDGDRLCISDSAQFDGVDSQMFEFNLAGYQVCKNWATAGNRSGIQRKGKPLTRHDVQLLRSVLFAIAETIAVRAEIDHVLAENLGW